MMDVKIFVPVGVICIILFFVGVYIALRKKQRWFVYKKQYYILSLLIIVVSLLYLISAQDNPIIQFDDNAQTILVSVLTGLIASIIWGIFNLESDPEFADKVSQEVAGIQDGTIPYKVYPRVQKEKKASPEFKENLIESMLKSNTYCYSGVDMTIAAYCIEKSIKRVEFGKKGAVMKEMLFIIPDLNVKKNKENKDDEIGKEIERRKGDSRKKLVKSIATINNVCSKAHYPINAHFYILPQRPTLHIHKTDEMSFWGLVDKVENCECPTTYCFKRSSNDFNKSSMYTAIDDLIQQTRIRIERNFIDGKHFEITWYGDSKGENANWQFVEKMFRVSFSLLKRTTIRYKKHHHGEQQISTIDDFVEAMRFN